MPFLTQKLRRVRPLLGTYIEVTLQGETDHSFLERCLDAGFEAIAQIDALMSFHKPDSDLARLNQAPAWEWLRLHPGTIHVLKTSNALFKSSNGIFDIRCGAALIKKNPLPMLTNAPPVEIRGTRVRKTGPWTLDLGGIAKGYAVDCAVKTIQHLARGLNMSGTVNAGGDLRTWGDPITMTARIEGVAHPWRRSFPVQHTALATSSTTAHVRMPAQTAVRRTRTATVFARSCMLADALTKIAILAPGPIVKRCFAAHHARAIVFRSNGMPGKVIA